MNFALIGEKLSYSLSGEIHRRLFKLRGIKADYSLTEIPQNKLLSYDFSSLAGFNVTAPYKTEIISRISKLSDRANLLQSVNTVFIKNGQMQGFNTDYDGFLLALKSAGHSLSGCVSVMGCGGAARTFCFAAAQNGCDINLIVRPSSLDKATGLAAELKSRYKGIKVDINADLFADLLINATPAGTLHNPDLLPFGADAINRCGCFFDAVYNPAQTPLIKMATAKGVPSQNGLLMLVYQAIKSQEIWFGSTLYDKDEQSIIDFAKDISAGGKVL
ncbi:MAG: shikimate dehydrogenase [Oscillospiraceae bacterium]|nr:shikimate dehydrogenase [Candidatus Equicaccousia limihippi]